MPPPVEERAEYDPFAELAEKENAAKTHDEWIRIHNKGLLDLYRNGYITEEQYLDKVGQERKELEKLATIDQLTGILNRRGVEWELDERLQEAGRLAERTGEYRGSAIIFDVDLFKEINDNYGHPVGDAALLAYVQAIKNLIRPGDVFGRWGGDEFFVYANEATKEEAKEIADRCRMAVIEKFKTNKEVRLDWEQTTSAGVAQLEINDTRESLIKKADDALYFAKTNGRNRSEIWTKETPEHALIQAA